MREDVVVAVRVDDALRTGHIVGGAVNHGIQCNPGRIGRVGHQHPVPERPIVVIAVPGEVDATGHDVALEDRLTHAKFVDEALQLLLDVPPTLPDDALTQRHRSASAGVRGRDRRGRVRDLTIFSVDRRVITLDRNGTGVGAVDLEGVSHRSGRSRVQRETQVVGIDRRSGVAVAGRLRGAAAVQVVAERSRVRAREQGIGVEVPAVEQEVVERRPVAEFLVPLDAEVVQLSAAPVGEIGTLETAARIRDRHMLDGVASIGASERVEARIGGEVTAILKHRDRHDELILVVQSPGPEHERPPIEIVGQGRGDLTALVRLELR